MSMDGNTIKIEFTLRSFVTFLLAGFVVLWSSTALSIRISREKDDFYSFDASTILLLSQIFHVLISLVSFILSETSVGPTGRAEGDWMKMVKGIKVCWKLVLPAFIVSVLNVTLFLNLRFYETAPYFMLSSSRVLVTGALHQWFVGRPLGPNKWAALAFLTLSDLFVHVPSLLQLDDLSFHFVLLVLVHSFASSFAQVFLEFRLKSDPEISAPVKSTYFSIFTALFSLLWILLSKPVLLQNERNFFSGYSTSVYLAALLFALTSAHTTFFLKCLSVFWLQFVQSMSFLLVALASYFLFDDVLSIDFLLAVGSFAVALYFLRSDVLSSFSSSSSSSPSQSFPHSILSEFSPKSHSDPSSKSLV